MSPSAKYESFGSWLFLQRVEDAELCGIVFRKPSDQQRMWVVLLSQQGHQLHCYRDNECVTNCRAKAENCAPLPFESTTFLWFSLPVCCLFSLILLDRQRAQGEMIELPHWGTVWSSLKLLSLPKYLWEMHRGDLPPNNSLWLGAAGTDKTRRQIDIW